MLTRLKVNGFKNLLDVDVRFGPFTCVAGPNGIGKSNLFDAISFLGRLADMPMAEAARRVRDDGGRQSEVESLFNKSMGPKQFEIEAEMLVPRDYIDDLGQHREATSTYLRYRVEIALRGADDPAGPLELVHESLKPIGGGGGDLSFPSSKEWRSSVIRQDRRAKTGFLETIDGQTIRKFQDKVPGRPLNVVRQTTPRTVLSTASATESPTLHAVRVEMRSWRLLQLDPHALREPDREHDPREIASNGAHMPATLQRLIANPPDTQSDVTLRIANRLGELIDDVDAVNVRHNAAAQRLILEVTNRDGVTFDARSLSDGTLRFLALAVLLEDPHASGVICFEEPENGIHPARIEAMIRLLRDIAVDPTLLPGEDNPLRQMLVNTHSPLVVQHVLPDDLLVAVPSKSKNRIDTVDFKTKPGTWRERSGSAKVVWPVDIGPYLEDDRRPVTSPSTSIERHSRSREGVPQLEFGARG